MENEEKKPKPRPSTATVRKACKHGVTSQKMMTFRIDLDVLELLDGIENKGRFINNVLYEHFKAIGKER